MGMVKGEDCGIVRVEQGVGGGDNEGAKRRMLDLGMMLIRENENMFQ